MRFGAVGVLGEELMENDFVRPGAPDRKCIADHCPLWFAEEAKDFAKIVDQSGENEPARVAVVPDLLGGLEQMFELRKIGIGIAVVNECVEEFHRFPDAHSAAGER